MSSGTGNKRLLALFSRITNSISNKTNRENYMMALAFLQVPSYNVSETV
jgi:hypothetical protein